MDKNKLLKVLLFTLLLVVIGTWFIPGSTIENMKVVTGEYNRVGIFKLVSLVMIAVGNFAQTSIYLLAIGGLYGVIYKLPAYKNLVNKIVDGFAGLEWIFFIVVGLFLALGSSMAGLSVVLLILLPFITSVILAMGYNKMTAAMLVVGSLLAGFMGTMFSASTIDGLLRVLSVKDHYAFITGDLLVKAILFVVTLTLVLVATYLYAKENKSTILRLESENKKMKIWPLVALFDLMLVVLVLGFISWGVLKVDLFQNITELIINPTGSTFSRGILGGFQGLLGLTSNPETQELTAFGHWTVLESAVVVLIATVAIGLAYKVKFDDALENFLSGCKKAIKPALLILIPYTILVVASTTGLTTGLLGNIMELGKGVNVVPMSLVSMGYSIFGVEPFYSFVYAQNYIMSSGADGIMGSLTATETNLIAYLWQSMYALIMLVAPTSVILITTLSYLEISYKDWLKSVWKLFIALYIALVLILYLYK